MFRPYATDGVAQAARRPLKIFASDPLQGRVQALNRTQPGLPMKKGRAGTVTHD